ncbi:MAG TPA: hypothetical protein VF744_04825 [Beijerinckiaceae bacterium]|jgi:hypothetical protein
MLFSRRSAPDGPLEDRIARLAGQPYGAVAGLLERGGERGIATFLLVCRGARGLSSPEAFDETALHCFSLLPQAARDRLVCLMASVAAEAMGFGLR